MEIFVTDENFERAFLIDRYESFIWTERYKQYGDFELIVPAERTFRQTFQIDTLIYLKETDRVMRVETLEEYIESEGQRHLRITGRSLEAIFEDRVAMPALDDLTTTPQWSITGTPKEIMHTLFESVYVDARLDPGDTLPFFLTTTTATDGDLPAPDEEVTIVFDPDSLYNSLKKVADTYNLGFRIYRSHDSKGLYFSVYTGNDKTTGQSNHIPVIFSTELDNLSNGASLQSRASYKNVAYVFAKNGAAIIYGDGVDPSISGFERRVLTVNASDIDLNAGAVLNTALEQRGREELAKYRAVVAFDGEIPQSGSYSYGWPNVHDSVPHYNLGDLVEQRSDDGLVTTLKVTEQIFSSNGEGDKSYPTLIVDTVATPGSWAVRAPNQVWEDVPDTEHWADL